jgi:lipid-A-disaccharide synthase-like uncharacterized protein
MLFFWGLAVLGGRLTAYATYIRIQSAIAVVVAAVLLLLLARALVRHFRARATTASSPSAVSTRKVEARV